MLLWLQQKLPKKNRFLFKLSLVSALAHSFLCFSLFFMYKDYQHSLSLQVRATHRPDDVIVRLLPISARPRAQKRVAVKNTSTLVKKTVSNVIKKKPQTKFAQVKKVIQKPKPKQETKPLFKPVEKIIKEQKEKPKEASKLVEKKVSEVKKENTPVQSQEVVKERQAEVKEESKSKENIKDSKIQEPIVEKVEENVQYVTHKELRGIELENALQAAVQEVWAPPVGIDQEVMSEVQVTVGWDGALVESKILKPSDIVIYDVAVQEALEEIKFPRQVWGKEIKIAFRP